jgi:hypothetical protein
MLKELHRLFPSTVGIYVNKDHSSHLEVRDMLIRLKGNGGLKTSSTDFLQTKTGIHLNKEMTAINEFVKKSVFDFIILSSILSFLIV